MVNKIFEFHGIFYIRDSLDLLRHFFILIDIIKQFIKILRTFEANKIINKNLIVTYFKDAIQFKGFICYSTSLFPICIKLIYYLSNYCYFTLKICHNKWNHFKKKTHV